MKYINLMTRAGSALICTALLLTSATSCVKKPENPDKDNGVKENINNMVKLPENENVKEEIIVNMDYANSDLISFDGTIEEIYEDGSMLIFSPFFYPLSDYTAIVEIDENTVFENDLQVKENQCITFNVYENVKRSEPLTVVAANLKLLKEVSTQKEEVEKKKQELQEKVDNLEINKK